MVRCKDGTLAIVFHDLKVTDIQAIPRRQPDEQGTLQRAKIHAGMTKSQVWAALGAPEGTGYIGDGAVATENMRYIYRLGALTLHCETAGLSLSAVGKV